MTDATTAGMSRLEDFSADLFRPYEGSRFSVLPEEGSPDPSAFEFELVEVTRLPARGTHDGTGAGEPERFSLLFKSVDGRTLGRGLHRLAHADFGGCEVFMQRVQLPIRRGASQNQVMYEAVFHIEPGADEGPGKP